MLILLGDVFPDEDNQQVGTRHTKTSGELVKLVHEFGQTSKVILLFSQQFPSHARDFNHVDNIHNMLLTVK